MSSVSSQPARACRPCAVLLAVAAACTFPATAQVAPPVLPSGENVRLGAATFDRATAGTLAVTTQNGAGVGHCVIDWNTFSIGAGGTARFVQPTASSTSINRVVTSDPSAIFGTLSSNGKLVLVNPAGITVGAGAVVDTAAFTASTLWMADADALAGTMAFRNDLRRPTTGPLRVNGAITASGDVILLGSQVEVGDNAPGSVPGTVSSARGAVIVAAGRSVDITGPGLEGIVMTVSPGDQAINLGTLQGDAVALFAGRLRHSGWIHATAVSTGGGKVVLRADAGDAQVDGSVGALRSSLAGPAPAGIEVTAAGSITGGGHYTAGAAPVRLQAIDGALAFGTIQSEATLAGGPGGEVTLTARQDIHGDAIQANGVPQATPGSGGGTVRVTSAAGNIALDSARADGGSAFATAGGDGGSIAILAGSGNVDLGTASAGGGQGLWGRPGDGGSIVLSAAGSGPGAGNIHVDAWLAADGGSGSVNSAGHPGGSGGTVTLQAHGDVVIGIDAAAGAPFVSASGGRGKTGSTASGNGGQGGAVTIVAETGDVRFVGAGGGGFATGGGGVFGGAGGTVAIRSAGTLEAARIAVTGGNGGQIAWNWPSGTGGNGGTVDLHFTGATGVLDGVAVIDASAGPGGPPAFTAPPGAQGAGGAITVRGDEALRGGGASTPRLLADGLPLGNPPRQPTWGGDMLLTAQSTTLDTVDLGGNIRVVATAGPVRTTEGTVQSWLRGGGFAVEASDGITLAGHFQGSGHTGLGLHTARGDITQAAGGIATHALVARADAGSVRLAGSNAVSVLAGSAGGPAAGFEFANGPDLLVVGRVVTPDAAVAGITASADVTLRTRGSLRVESAIQAPGGDIVTVADGVEILALLDAGSGRASLRPLDAARPIILGGSDEAGALNLTQAELDRIFAGTLAIGDLAQTGGISIAAPTSVRADTTLSLRTGGAITQAPDALLAAGQLAVDATSVELRDVALGNGSGGVLAGRARAGALAFHTRAAAPLQVGTVDGLAGLTAMGPVSLATPDLLRLAQPVRSEAAGTAIVLAAADLLREGAGGLEAPGGRWLVYLPQPTANLATAPASGQLALWGRTFALDPPESIAASGHRYLFATAPLVTVVAVDSSKVYDGTGGFVPLAFTSSGLVNAADFGNVFLQDAFSGAPATPSEAKNVGSYAITQGTLLPPAGYALAFTPGLATVRPAPLAIAASKLEKAEGEALVFQGTEFTVQGLVGAETVDTVTLTSAGAAATAPAGTYPITPAAPIGGNGFRSANYAISFLDGTLDVLRTATAAEVAQVGNQLVTFFHRFRQQAKLQPSLEPADRRREDPEGREDIVVIGNACRR